VFEFYLFVTYFKKTHLRVWENGAKEDILGLSEVATGGWSTSP
jgi:hypothetical protein